MIPLLQHLWDALLHDEMAIKRWLRGGLLLVSTTAAQVVPYGMAAIHDWEWMDWAVVLAISLGAGLAGLINLGEPNAKPLPR
jgi:hypothetical protein